MIVTGCDRMVKYGSQVKIIRASELTTVENLLNEFIIDRYVWKIIPVDHEVDFVFMVWYMETKDSN